MYIWTLIGVKLPKLILIGKIKIQRKITRNLNMQLKLHKSYKGGSINSFFHQRVARTSLSLPLNGFIIIKKY